MFTRALVLIPLCFGAGQASAQVLEGLGISPIAPSGSISTGRPSASVGTGTVPRGYLQLESGLIFLDGSTDTVAAPLLTMRAGVRENLELRFSWSGYTFYDDTDDFEGNDITLGVKATIYQESNSPWQLGVLAEVSLPAGSDRASADSADPSVGLLWDYDAQGDTNVFGNLVISAPENAGEDRNLAGTATLGVGTPLNQRTNVYSEYAGTYGEGQGPEHNLYTGVLYLLSDDVQVDLNARIGLNDRADDYGFGAGLAVRF